MAFNGIPGTMMSMADESNKGFTPDEAAAWEAMTEQLSDIGSDAQLRLRKQFRNWMVTFFLFVALMCLGLPIGSFVTSSEWVPVALSAAGFVGALLAGVTAWARAKELARNFWWDQKFKFGSLITTFVQPDDPRKGRDTQK